MSDIAVAKSLVEAAFTIDRQHLPLEKAELDLVRAYINLVVRAVEKIDLSQFTVLDGEGNELSLAALNSLHLPATVASRLLVTLESLGFKAP